jgi:pimeloyl-ACP methyl ester carboxylesterase
MMQEILKINIDDFTFDCRTAGNTENELVILLHGWPETSYMWKPLMTDLSEKGYYCVAPNLRGYSVGACPEEIAAYSLDLLINDVLAIFKHFKKSKFHLIGHDWGALIGWKLVHDHPDKILSWTALSVPHLQAMGTAMLTNEEQIKMSEYVENFQIPALPEQQIQKDDYKLLRKLWEHCNAETVEDYLNVFTNQKQLTATINYYRSNYKLLKSALENPILGDIQVPTLFIWGNTDLAVSSFAVSEHHQYMKGDYEFIELDTGHWLIQTSYEALESSITTHISRNRNTA